MAVNTIISTQEITKGYSEHPLFSNLSIAIEEGARLAIIGDNGSGKSTLLKILAGIEDVDSGLVTTRKGLLCSYVPQQESFPTDLSVREVIEEFLSARGLDHSEIARRASITLGGCGFDDPHIRVATLSGGWRKRLAIARALALEPDCILLDEPTNHLDIDSIAWLEERLDQFAGSLIFVSHDRYFIERLATRVLEINRIYPRDYLLSDGTYSDFIEYREENISQLQQQRQSLANKVRREVEWLRQGVKARTTKSRARINEAHRLIDKLKDSPTGQQKRAELEFSTTQRKTKELLKAERIAQAIEGKPLFDEVSLVLSPGSRLAVVGPNGSGKTTFVKTLLGQLSPTKGRVVKAPNLRFVFMDQTRSGLNDELTLKEFLCPHGDSVVFQNRSLHVAAWAARFLFTHQHLATTLGALSGGERARALLAKIMTEECDVLVFDEPTNDLDIATLENLEESFESFPGAIVLITHDRYLLDRTASMVLGLDGNSSALYGSYSQWESARKARATERPKNTQMNSERATKGGSGGTKKLSYKDARELSMIEGAIEKAEAEVARLQGEIDSGEYTSNAAKLTELCDALMRQQDEVERLYERWQALEELQRMISL